MAIGSLVVLFLREARMNLETHPATSRPGPGRWVRDGTESLLKAARLQRSGVSVASPIKNQPVGGGEASRQGLNGVGCGG